MIRFISEVAPRRVDVGLLSVAAQDGTSSRPSRDALVTDKLGCLVAPSLALASNGWPSLILQACNNHFSRSGFWNQNFGSQKQGNRPMSARVFATVGEAGAVPQHS